MPKILSFEVSDELYERVVTAQQKAQVNYLSPFLRTLVEDALLVLEQNEEKNNG
jgi:hypothetical protein